MHTVNILIDPFLEKLLKAKTQNQTCTHATNTDSAILKYKMKSEDLVFKKRERPT